MAVPEHEPGLLGRGVSRTIAAVMVCALVCGCGALLGVDFDDAHPRAGSGDGGCADGKCAPTCNDGTCSCPDGTVACADGCCAAGSDGGSGGDGGQPSMTATAIAAGIAHACVLTSDGRVACWGANDSSQLGTGSADGRTPRYVQGIASGATAICAGGSHSCAVVGGGVKCWGANDTGQLGNGSNQASPAPVDVSGLSGATAVACGSGFSCALAGGGVQCWGAGGSGRLGNGQTSDSYIPAQVTGLTSGVAQIAIGAAASYACARLASGDVWCWGANDFGQVSLHDTDAHPSPVATGITGGVLAAGQQTTCIISGQAACWGDNTAGQIEPSNYARTLSGAPAVSQVRLIAQGSGHACAVGGDSIDCWGANEAGQQGAGTVVQANHQSALTVKNLPGTNVKALAAGQQFTCALTNDGRVWCWGANDHHEMGNEAAPSPNPTPMEVRGL